MNISALDLQFARHEVYFASQTPFTPKRGRDLLFIEDLSLFVEFIESSEKSAVR